VTARVRFHQATLGATRVLVDDEVILYGGHIEELVEVGDGNVGGTPPTTDHDAGLCICGHGPGSGTGTEAQPTVSNAVQSK